MLQVALTRDTPRIEDAMTLQIGLVARNGFVLASDTLVQNRAPGTKGTIRSSRTKKIHLFEAAGLVVAYAGHDPPTSFGYRLRDAWDASRADETIDREARAWFAANPTLHPSEESEIIIGSSAHSKLWHVTGASERATVTPYLDKITTRNSLSLAPFIAEHFYSTELPLKAMTTLAALTIWYGERQGNTTIRGLQVVTCEDERIRELSNDETNALLEECSRLHSRIGAVLLSPGAE